MKISQIRRLHLRLQHQAPGSLVHHFGHQTFRECPQLKCAKRVLRYSKREAMRRGYQPCKVCGG